MILFLDFDGVLHPDAVFLEKGKPILRVPGQLFMWAPLLTEALAEFPEVKIVLSTSWVRVLRFSRAKAYLPEPIGCRVIGATWHSGMRAHPEAFHHLEKTWWDSSTRYQQIRRYADRARLSKWVAVDDHPEGWGDTDLDSLVVTDSMTGLSGTDVMGQLTDKLIRARTS